MTSPSTLHVASAQYPIGQPKSLAEWDEKIAVWVKSGAATGAELLVFPEYAAIEQAACFGAEVYGDLKTTLAKVAELATHRVRLHLDLAKKHNVHILVGSGPRLITGGHYVNTAQLVTPGGLVGEQDKLIMTPFERDWGISAGGPVRVFTTSIGSFGIAICYDSEFPLLVRSMAEAGADVVLVPSCTERISGYHAQAAWPGRSKTQSPQCRAQPLATRRGHRPLILTQVRQASMFRPNTASLMTACWRKANLTPPNG
jgi:predicted amidohydrolase